MRVRAVDEASANTAPTLTGEAPIAAVRGARGPRRVAMLSVHTSPLDQPGTGDAGGMNVYVVELSGSSPRPASRSRSSRGRRRATCLRSRELAPGITVRHVIAGPLEGLTKAELPGAAVHVRPRGAAHRGDSSRPATTTSSTPTTGCRARWARSPATAGACRWSTRCTRWPRSRTARSPTATRRSRRRASSARSRSSRRRTSSSPTPTKRPASWSTCTTPTRHRIGSSAPGVDLDIFRPGDKAAARSRLGMRPDALR